MPNHEIGFVFLFEVAGKRSRSGKRSRLVGAAKVRVDAIVGDECDVTLLQVSGPLKPGIKQRRRRAEVFITAEERQHFAEQVRRAWPSREKGVS